MNYTITLFDAPSRTDTVTVSKQFDLQDFPKALQEHIANRTNDLLAPKWFNFSTWRKYHDLKDYQGSSGIVLEYSKRSETEWALIADAVVATQFKCFVFDTIDGVALVFPIEGVTQNNDYTRALSILSEIIGQEGMIAEPGATYLVRPKKGAVVFELGSDVLDFDELKNDFSFVPKDSLSKWRTDFATAQPTRDIIPPKPKRQSVITPAAQKAQQTHIAKTQKSKFDELFDLVDEKMTAAEKSAEEFRKAVGALKVVGRSMQNRIEALDNVAASQSISETIKNKLPLGFEFNSIQEAIIWFIEHNYRDPSIAEMVFLKTRVKIVGD